MHFYTTDTDVTLTGTKENIIRILNTAMRNAEADIVIAESDDLETMFQKVKEVDNNQQFLLPDFLDEKSIQECDLQEKQNQCRHEYRDECYDWVGVYEIINDGEDYTVKLGAHVHEEVEIFCMDDWVHWGNKASRLYQCLITMKSECYCDGELEDTLSFTFDPDGEEIQLAPPITTEKVDTKKGEEEGIDLPF